MQFLATSFAILSFLTALICLILLIKRLVLDSLTDSTLPINKNAKSHESISNSVSDFESDSKLIKRLDYLDSPISSFRLYENINILTKIIPLFIASRGMIFLINLMFYLVEKPDRAVGFNCLREIWSRWDTAHYISIAEYGYQNIGDEKFLLVFYPLYPFLINIFNRFVGDYFLSGLLVSNICLLASLFYLYRLVLSELGEEEIAFKSIKYILIFPFSFFFSIVYTESLFIYLCIMTFYFLRNKNWFLSGLMGFFAVLTRTQGILLLIPIMTEMAYDYASLKTNIQNNKSGNKLIIYFQMITCLMLVPLGTFGYLLINKLISGKWLTFLVYQKEHWSQSFGFFAENIKNGFTYIFTMNTSMAVNIWIPQTFLFFISFGLLIYSYKNMRMSYTLFSLAYILISFSPTWLLSGSRYITGMFTLFIMLAIFVYKNKHLETYVDFVSTILLCFYCIQFSLSRVF